jgi:hypothetical protein
MFDLRQKTGEQHSTRQLSDRLHSEHFKLSDVDEADYVQRSILVLT